MFFAEVIGIREERDANLGGGGGVIGAGVCENGVALSDQGFSKELAEVAKPYNGNF